ncbi:hypothetical protein [Mycoplasma suis]|uniref:Uncharacterized protein n=2 Tax=Mycoplasma suis TaxID=57372 RepID=F0QQH0_MYCSL|nr:hypothetical protein [Mycoplasma suis]ADX97740.1 hypothetical protein MSU_0196 [Mycoplasma suis str. Illinois]CBZ40290.1 hypothetical protein MSUIS_01970 [Mycoplasma suis KI3806]
MILKGLGGYGWTLIAGVGSALGIGGYGVTKFLGNSIEENISSFSWKTIVSKFNQKINSAFYVSKERSEGKNETCKKWVNGSVQDMYESECKNLIKKNWTDKGEKQPEIWIETDKESIEEVLLEHFSSNNSSITKETFLGKNNWNIGEMLCKKEEKENKLEVSCSYKEEPESPSN